MSLFNHLFGGGKDAARKLLADEDMRKALWEEHIANFEAKERLSKHFSFGNVDRALADFAALESALSQIESLISPELVTIAEEEKADADIIADLGRLRSKDQIVALSETIVSVKEKQADIIRCFEEIFNVLQAELRLIRVIRKRPANARELLLKLFGLIFHNEAMLYKIFREQFFSEERVHIHSEIVHIAKATICGKKVEEEMERDEERFAREMIALMMPGESAKRYRKLGEDVFYELANMAGAPLPRETEIVEGLRRMEQFMMDDSVMRKIVKRLRPKYEEAKLKAVIIAFRRAYDLGHFIDLEDQLAT